MPSRLVLALSAALAAACATAPAPAGVAAPPPGAVTLGVFERSLVPYGEWMFVAPYGRVWRPAGVGPGWRPYFYGEWMWTDEGWYWESDEPWGWATYHYGRWTFDPRWGWIWAPGLDWAPAWVAWGTTDGFVGWTPLGPAAEAWWTGAFIVDATYWTFVPSPRFVGVRVNTVAVPPAQVGRIVPRVRPAPPPGHGIATAPPLGGPPRPLVERDLGRPVPAMRIVPVETPDAARARPAPASVHAYRPAPPPASRPAPPPARPEERR